MDMQPTGYRELLIVKSNRYDFDIIISGKFENYKAEQLNYRENIAKVEVQGDFSIETINRNGQLELNKTMVMIPTFFEDGIYDITFSGDVKYKVIQVEKPIELIQRIKKYPIREGKIKFRSDIGYSTFYIKDKDEVVGGFTIEVFPTKINYKEDYKKLLDEVNLNMEALAFDIFDRTFLNAKLVEKARTNNEFLSILRIIFKELEDSLLKITRNFKHNIETIEQIERIDRVRRTSNKTRGYLRTHPNVLERDSKGFIDYGQERYIPNKAISIRKKTTIDIFENRYVKYAIKNIIARLVKIENIVLKSDGKVYLEFIKDKKKRLNSILRDKFNEIGDLNYSKEVNLVFQMTPGYKEFYKNYILLRRGLDFSEGMMEITPKKMYKLYEIWCYIKLHNMLKELGCTVIQSDIINARNNGLTINLIQDKDSKILYTKGDKSIELWYNKSYDGLPTTTQRPDVVLIIKEKNKKERIYIFDAKYRIKVDNYSVSVEEDDINIMHRYRDSIVAEIESLNQFEYRTFGAYVMFPCEKEEEFQNDKYYKSIDKVNIGAFPMLPSKNNLMYKHLKEILNEEEEFAHKRRVLTEISMKELMMGEIEPKEKEESSEATRKKLENV